MWPIWVKFNPLAEQGTQQQARSQLMGRAQMLHKRQRGYMDTVLGNRDGGRLACFADDARAPLCAHPLALVNELRQRARYRHDQHVMHRHRQIRPRQNHFAQRGFVPMPFNNPPQRKFRNLRAGISAQGHQRISPPHFSQRGTHARR